MRGKPLQCGERSPSLGGREHLGRALGTWGQAPRIPRAPSLPGEDAAMGLGRLCFGGGGGGGGCDGVAPQLGVWKIVRCFPGRLESLDLKSSIVSLI